MYIDIGNSFIKIANFTGSEWNLLLRAPIGRVDDAIRFVQDSLKLPPDASLPPSDRKKARVLACSVVPDVRSQMEKKLARDIRFVTVSDFPAGRIAYDTPGTLGIDRVLACLGASSQSGDKPVIVIDAGTAVTIDLMDPDGVFAGGVIAPGISLFEKGLRQHAPALPAVERSLPPGWPPKSTQTALQWGITGSFLEMVVGHCNRFLEIRPDARIWITGGDAALLAQIRTLKLQYHPNLIMAGLLAWEQEFS